MNESETKIIAQMAEKILHIDTLVKSNHARLEVIIETQAHILAFLQSSNDTDLKSIDEQAALNRDDLKKLIADSAKGTNEILSQLRM